MRIARCCIVATTMLAAVVAVAQGSCFDPPRPPVIKADVFVRSIILTADQDDGLDGNAELYLTVNVNAGKCGQRTKSYEIDYDWDTDHARGIFDTIWSHLECTPRREITVGTALIEVDSDLSTNIMSGLAGAAAGLAVGAIGGPVGAIGGAAAGFVVGLVLSLNGNDDLGVGSGVVPENGLMRIQSRGPDGGADIFIDGATTDQAGSNCHTSPPAPPRNPPNVRTQQVYNPLQESLPLVPMIVSESGNPGNLDDDEIAGIRKTLERSVLGLAALGAATEIEQAYGFLGVNEAIALYHQARAADQLGDSAEALQKYREAFFAAATANDNYVKVRGLMRLPFHIVLSTDCMQTKAHRKPRFVIFAPGGRLKERLSFHGLPPEMALKLQPLGDGAYELDVSIGSAAPGRYLLHIDAHNGLEGAQAVVEIVVNG
ncbi:MAG: hypothetical protein HUU60_05165 [Armatimonadetes bacterium]|nr:hypothetical protein [Armatimonadota bacterium]